MKPQFCLETEKHVFGRKPRYSGGGKCTISFSAKGGFQDILGRGVEIEGNAAEGKITKAPAVTNRFLVSTCQLVQLDSEASCLPEKIGNLRRKGKKRGEMRTDS